MSEFIAPVVDKLIEVILARTPDLLAADALPEFAETRMAFTGVAVNLPAIWVMPRRTRFDDEGTPYHELHEITVKMAIEADTPEAVTEAALLYVRAVHHAIEEGDREGDFAGCISEVILGTTVVVGAVERVFVVSHEYGPLFGAIGGNAMAKLPELDVLVEVRELQDRPSPPAG